MLRTETHFGFPTQAGISRAGPLPLVEICKPGSGEDLQRQEGEDGSGAGARSDAIHSYQEMALVTDLLEEAFARATQLPDDEQDAFARRLMDELESERHWSRSFETSQRQLANLAREALAEDLVGRTEPLDPDRLLHHAYILKCGPCG